MSDPTVNSDNVLDALIHEIDSAFARAEGDHSGKAWGRLSEFRQADFERISAVRNARGAVASGHVDTSNRLHLIAVGVLAVMSAPGASPAPAESTEGSAVSGNFQALPDPDNDDPAVTPTDGGGDE